jgi:hypothetical protein
MKITKEDIYAVLLVAMFFSGIFLASWAFATGHIIRPY